MKKPSAPKPLPAEFLIQRGKCCGSKCHNCPYITSHGERHVAGTHEHNKAFVAFIKAHPKKHWSEFLDQIQETR